MHSQWQPSSTSSTPGPCTALSETTGRVERAREKRPRRASDCQGATRAVPEVPGDARCPQGSLFERLPVGVVDDPHVVEPVVSDLGRLTRGIVDDVTGCATDASRQYRRT